MRAMVLETARTPLRMRERPTPVPAAREILLEVAACGVCRTDLHVVDGELANPKLPLIPGHEIVGRVAVLGADVAGFAVGERIGVPWLGYTCVCAIGRCLPATPEMAATRRMRSPMRASAFRCPSGGMTPRSHRSSAPG